MCDTDCRVSSIDALTTVTTGAIDIDAKVVWIDLEVFFCGLGKYSNCGSRSMNAALRLGDWYALYAMYTTFEFELTVGIVAGNFENDFFGTAGFVFVFGY